MARKKLPAKKTPPNKANGPYVSIAALCERVLEDKDGVNSLIRIVDMFTIRAEAIPGGPLPPPGLAYFPGAVSFNAVVGFKAGKAKGSRTLKLIARRPTGEPITEASMRISLDGPKEPRGAVVQAPMTLPVREEGVHWIDVFLNDELVTRIPLQVVYERVEHGSPTRPRAK